MNRSSAAEIMDDLECQGEVVHQTLRELEFINKWLGGNSVTLDALDKIIPAGNSPLSIADLGCGSGEMLKLIADRTKRYGRPLQLTGIDANPHIISYAKENCREYPGIELEALNIMLKEFQEKKFDIVIGTLFYHHFSTEELVTFFSKLRKQVNVGIIINDIHRHWLAHKSILLLTKLFSRSSMVKYDAPLSVMRAFSKAELESILKASGFSDFQIAWKWAFRWQVIAKVGGEFG